MTTEGQKPTVGVPRPVRIRVWRDDAIPAFGGWAAGSLKDGQPTILLNVAACMMGGFDEEGNPIEATTKDRKWLMISTLMHEFGHALQEFFDLEFTEERIEEMATEYEKFYRSQVAQSAEA